MKNKILGSIAAIWGLLILVNGLLSAPTGGSEAYSGGFMVGLVFGALLLVLGLFYFFRKPSGSKP